MTSKIGSEKAPYQSSNLGNTIREHKRSGGGIYFIFLNRRCASRSTVQVKKANLGLWENSASSAISPFSRKSLLEGTHVANDSFSGIASFICMYGAPPRS